MKIGIFCDAFVPENKAVAIRIYHLAEAFRNNDVKVIVHTATISEDRSLSFHVRKTAFNAPSNEGSLLKRLIAECLLGFEFFLRVLFSDFDMILISSPPFFTSVCAVLGCRIKGIRYIFDVRDEYPEVFFSAGIIKSASIMGEALRSIENLIYKNAFMVTSVTEGICRRISQKISQSNVYLLRNGFDESLFHPSDDKESQFTIIFHGNIGKFQNPQLLIDLAEMASKKELPLCFKVIGWGNNDEVLKNISFPNLHFLGKVEYKKIPEIISKSHLGISVRSNDVISFNSFPVKLYEYIGVGLPSFVVPISEAGAFVEKHELGYQFSEDSIDDMLDKIELLASNHLLYSEMVDRVCKIRPLFSRQKINHEFVKEVLKRST